jgi:cardiolipin synthase
MSGVGRSLGAAFTGNRPLEDFELRPITMAALVLVAVAVVGFLFPRVLAWPVAALSTWVAITLVVDAWTIWRHRSE